MEEETRRNLKVLVNDYKKVVGNVKEMRK